MKELQEMLDSLEPGEALAVLSPELKKLLAHLDEETRVGFVVGMLGGAQGDKIGSLVDLWLAECMGEGVDPTQMCQTLVHKVAQSKQLMAVTDPEILSLFENWLDELEDEVVSRLRQHPGNDATDLAEHLGLSRSGANFMVAKLRREGKIQGGEK